MDETVKETTEEVKQEEVKNETSEKSETKDAMIPKTRFDEINSKYKEMADKVAEFEAMQAKAKAEAEAKELEAKKEQGKFEELYLNTQKELEAVKQYES
ncbi:hypothetical protein PVN23_21535, partial [Bacillus licheniformis]|nr:hypothetical protein [Bacillus licheniformis]